MNSQVSRFDLYEFLFQNKSAIVEDAVRLGKSIGLPDEIKNRVGPTGANSALPGTLHRDVIDSIEKGMMRIQSPRDIGDDIRRVVKSVYGQDFDAVPTNSCESALLATYDSLFTPPTIGAGDPYRARVIGMLERHIEHHLSYGRPFPPRYKDGFADRGATAGELGVIGRAQFATDCVLVPMAGARYELHGLKMHATPLLVETNARETAAALTKTAARHEHAVAGFISLAYDTIGYGYGEKGADGVPVLQKHLGALAREYDVPYVTDNAWGLPFVGADPRGLGADLMLYSMDKVGGAPTTGLVIGKEWPIVNIRRALGVHGDRFGTPSAHGKGLHVHADPGKMSMLGLLAALRKLRDRPEEIRAIIDAVFDIVTDEFQRARGNLPEGIVITKSYNLGGVEVNYEGTWHGTTGESQTGLPIFNNEDRVAGSNLLAHAMQAMGVLPGPMDDGNIIINPGLGTSDDSGQLIEDHMRLVVRAMFQALSLLHDWGARYEC